MRVFDARLQSGANTAPAGQVTAVGAEALVIALNGGTLTVKKLRNCAAMARKSAARYFLSRPD